MDFLLIQSQDYETIFSMLTRFQVNTNLFEGKTHSFSSPEPTILLTCVRDREPYQGSVNKVFYYTTQAVRGPITKINQSKCSIVGPIFSKYRTGHCPEWSHTCVFVVFARDRTGRISALGLFCTDLAALGPCCQDLEPIFSQYGPRAWLIRYMYCIVTMKNCKPRLVLKQR